MATNTDRGQDIQALYRLINQADRALDTIPDPHPSIASARESLSAAVGLAQILADSNLDAGAAAFAARGGQASKMANLSRDPDYYKKIASLRKTKSGGRPRKAS